MKVGKMEHFVVHPIDYPHIVHSDLLALRLFTEFGTSGAIS